jgi:hypothetical protein
VISRLRITWLSRKPGTGVPRDVRLARFQQVLLSAQRTRRYQPALERAGLNSPGAINRLCSIEEALQKLPCMDWAEFQGSPADFYNPAAPAPALQRLRYPTNHQIRTAVLGPRLVESASVRVFHPDWIDQIWQFKPEAIAGPVAVLMRLADAACQADAASPRVTRAIVAFTGLEHGALSDTERDRLWQVFEVPIFEQYLGADGSLLAWECEAHEGLHTVEENAIVEPGSGSGLILTSLTDHRYPTIRLVTSLAARLETGVCACGHPGPRLLGLSTPTAQLKQSAIAAGSQS